MNECLDIFRLNYNDEMYENINFENNILNNYSIKEMFAEGIGVLPNIYNYNKIIEDSKGENLW